VGDDLREGKPTPLLAIARERATGAHVAALARVGDPQLGPDDIAALQAVLHATGAPEEVERRIAELTDEAMAAAKELPLAEEAKSALADLATYVAWRDR